MVAIPTARTMVYFEIGVRPNGDMTLQYQDADNPTITNYRRPVVVEVMDYNGDEYKVLDNILQHIRSFMVEHAQIGQERVVRHGPKPQPKKPGVQNHQDRSSK